MSLLTAAEAYALTGVDFTRFYDLVASKIEFSARNKLRKAYIRDYPFRHWFTTGHVMKPWEVDLHDTLRTNGYTLQHVEELRFNSIDMALVINYDLSTEAP